MNFKDIENLSDIISNQSDSTKEIFDKLFHKAVRLCMEGLKVEINFQKVTSDTIRVKLTVPENDDNISHSLFSLESDNSEISGKGQYIDIPVNNIDNPEVCDSFMPKIDRIIQNNMQDSDFSVDALAREMNMSRTALYAKFKSVNENTIGSYINCL